MIIDTLKKVVFFRARKTGSSTMYKILSNYLEINEKYKPPKIYGHSSPNDIKHIINIDEYQKIIGVRNPYSTVVSWFWWVNRNNNLENMEKQEIIKKFNEELPKYKDFNYDIYDWDFDHIIRLENIEIDLYKVLNRLNIKVSIFEIRKIVQEISQTKWSKTNIQKIKIPLKEYFNEKNMKIMKERYNYYFKRFGYNPNILP